jgi:hypothetical protein
MARAARTRPDGLAIAVALFKIEPSVFLKALHIQANEPISRETGKRIERLRRAILGLRQVIPQEFFTKWAHQQLPRTDQSPLGILEGDNGFDEFVGLIEGIIHGDFS